MLTRKGQDLLAVAALVGMLAVAGTVAMIRIDLSQQPIDPTRNPSPLGYTYSLALFVIPCLVFGVWVWRSPRTAAQRRACRSTLLLLIPLGFVLDVFLGRTFLRFPNREATLGLLLRFTPCLFGLYTIIVLLYLQLPSSSTTLRAILWQGKSTVTFSDMLTCVRRALWEQWYFQTQAHSLEFSKLSLSFQETILYALAPAA